MASATTPTRDTPISPEAVAAAHARIRAEVRRTPVLRSRLLDEHVGASLFFKAEHLQPTGAFKFRGATHVLSLLDAAQRRRGVVTHSSGNHAQALALAAQRAGVPATIVMPRGSNPLKRAATLGYGARVVECENTQAERERTCERERDRTGAHLVHPYDDHRIIAGAGTAALELIDEVPDLDAIITPVGGGGLLAGCALAADGRCAVFGAEPTGADDAARGLARGERVTEQRPDTVADGLRTCLGQRNFAIIREHVEQVGTATDDEILEATWLIHTRMKQLVEPSAAVPLACLLAGSLPARGRIGIVLSGGNFDPGVIAQLYDQRIARNSTT